tara:strand:- start:184 stop:456 length:273 start_codon:yes stop_codon:yes gene_type:complete
MKNLTQKQQDRLDDIKLLLDNNEFVAWKNDLYQLTYNSANKNEILVVCTENDYTTGLCESDILDCYTDKFTIRENEYPQIKNISTIPDNK